MGFSVLQHGAGSDRRPAGRAAGRHPRAKRSVVALRMRPPSNSANHVAVSGDRFRDGRAASLGEFRNRMLYARQAGTGRILMRSGPLRGCGCCGVRSAPATIEIEPHAPYVDNGATVQSVGARLRPARLHAGPCAGARVDATAGSIDGHGPNTGGIARRRGQSRAWQSLSAKSRVTVGSHEVGLPFADRARFSTVPHGGSGQERPRAMLDAGVACRFAYRLATTNA